MAIIHTDTNDISNKVNTLKEVGNALLTTKDHNTKDDFEGQIKKPNKKAGEILQR